MDRFLITILLGLRHVKFDTILRIDLRMIIRLCPLVAATLARFDAPATTTGFAQGMPVLLL